MDKIILSFLANHRVCSLTTLLSDGSPHAASMHYSHQEEPLTFYFSTEKTGRKMETLLGGKPGKASVVVGFSEEEWKTLQVDGEVQAILDQKELASAHKIHYQKIREAKQYRDDQGTVFLAF